MDILCVFNLLIGSVFLNLGSNKQSNPNCDYRSICNINALKYVYWLTH